MGWVAYPGELGLRRYVQEFFDIPTDKFDAKKLLLAAALRGHWSFTTIGHWRGLVAVTAIAGGVTSGYAHWFIPYIRWVGLPHGLQRFGTWELEYTFPGSVMLARGVMDDAGHKTENLAGWRFREWETVVPGDGILRWDERSAGALQLPHEPAAVRYYGFAKWISWLGIWT
jgi:hypothetical protein